MLFCTEADIFMICFGEYKFGISAKSFYQVNPVQTEKLYSLAVEMAKLCNDDVVFDLYCGIGTIGIFASKFVNKVYGIEIVEDAVRNAKENASLNGINNCEFFAGDVERILDNIIKKDRPNVVFVDPPRKGLDDTTINNLMDVRPEKIVYISCNPATLVRDLAKMENSYKIQSITPIDLFPFTEHVECVAVLEAR